MGDGGAVIGGGGRGCPLGVWRCHDRRPDCRGAFVMDGGAEVEGGQVVVGPSWSVEVLW